ncbi:MAG: GlsB/YeaQ/YmgE family stress response membrane protein [Novosphingobium sp.]
MRFVWMAIVGLIVGIIARFIYPGPIPIGWIASILLGIAGSFLAGTIGGMIHRPADGNAIQPAGFFYSVIGAILIIFIARNVLHMV